MEVKDINTENIKEYLKLKKIKEEDKSLEMVEEVYNEIINKIDSKKD